MAKKKIQIQGAQILRNVVQRACSAVTKNTVQYRIWTFCEAGKYKLS
jgi:hypothetical protein